MLLRCLGCLTLSLHVRRMSWNSSGSGQIAWKKKWCLWPAPQLSHFSELSYFVNYIALYSKLIPGLSLTSTMLWMPIHDYSNGLFMYRVVSCPVTRSISRTIAPLLYHCELCAWHSVLQVGCVGYSGRMLMDISAAASLQLFILW